MTQDTDLTPADAAARASHLTAEVIHGLVAAETWFRHGTLTICVLDLTNGAQVTGESNCIDPANYSAELGAELARKDAIERVWSLEGYALKTRPAPTGDNRPEDAR